MIPRFHDCDKRKTCKMRTYDDKAIYISIKRHARYGIYQTNNETRLFRHTAMRPMPHAIIYKIICTNVKDPTEPERPARCTHKQHRGCR